LVPPAADPSAYGPAVAMTALPPALAAPPDVKSLLKSLKRHWLLATTLGLLAAAAASAAVWYFTPVKWVGEVVLRLNMTKVIKSGLDDREGASPFSNQTLASFAKARFVAQAALQEKGIAELPSVREQLDPVEWLRNKIDVGFVNQSPELLSISMTGNNPLELKALVDAVARAYRKQLGKAEGEVRLRRVEKLDAVIGRLDDFVKRNKKVYAEEVKAIGAANPNQRQHAAEFDKMLLQSLQMQKVGEQQKLNRLQIQLAQAKERKPGTIYIPETAVLAKLKEEKSYQSLKAQIEHEEEELLAAVKGYENPKHPKLEARRKKIAQDKSEFKALERKLIPEIKKDLAEYYQLAKVDSEQVTNDDIAATRALIELMDRQEDRLEDQIKKQGSDSIVLDDLLATFKPEEGVLDRLRETRAVLKAEIQESTSSAEEQDPAYAREQQNMKKMIMMAGGAGVAAMGLVMLIIAYWEFRARRINTVEDVVYGLGWRLVGQLPALPDRSRGLLRRQADSRYWQNLMTESVDATRTMILHAARVDGLRTVMVTSAVSGEGKTSLSCHLACSLARAGRKTLLLDCDLRNPAAHRLFELPGEPGLCEVLRGEAQLADVIRATPAKNLWLIPAGQFDEDALQTCTLSQNGFSPLLDRLKTQFDFIVIDSSPVLPVVDTLVIGQNVDVVVFSLLRDVSRIPNVYAAYQRLATLGIRILGAVVNGVTTGSYGYSSQYAKQTS
jgi:capsular exopolysaccharide synthesis family protein